MKIKDIGIRLAICCLAVASALLASPTSALKASAATGFTNASIRGTYVYESEGFAEVNPNFDPNIGPVTSDYAPFAAAGFFAFDGTGGMLVHDTVYIQGAIRHRNFEGTYSINPDGSGTLTFLSFGGTPKTRELFIAKAGEEIKFVVTDKPDLGTVNSGTMVRQSVPSED
jgi:hypothetical protein